MDKYNFYSKADLKEYFNAKSDLDLRTKILNTYDSLSFAEAGEFVNAIRRTGVDVVNDLTDNTPYQEIKRNRELSIEESAKLLNNFSRELEKEENFEKSLSTYEKDVYHRDQEEFEHVQLINDLMDLEESERGRTIKTYEYENKAKEINERMDKYRKLQQEKLEQNRASYKKSDVTLDDIIKGLD